MDLISISLDRVKFEIPPEILQEAFMPRRYDPARREFMRDNQLGVSVDAMVRRQIIDARVSIDVNLCSGVETTIPLHSLTPEIIDLWNRVYRIPKSLTGGRTITSLYSLSYGSGNVLGSYQPTSLGSSALMEAAAGVLQSNTPMPIVQTAYLTIVGENAVLITDLQQFPGLLYLRCQLTHEPNFANIKPAYYDAFTELVVLATKAWIYNRLIITLDEGQIKAGASIGRFREVVDGYADSNQMYKDHLREKWRIASFHNDTEKYRRHLRRIVGGRR